ncbi:MAG: MEDS domain-containing protein [Methylocystis sp.]|uniref:MEDS domain-containing protein n=1 Tax=Methylocystis sp. TaxID=1911079 RepID=UPI003DA4291D
MILKDRPSTGAGLSAYSVILKKRGAEVTTRAMNFLTSKGSPQELPRKSGLAAVGDVPWGTHFCLSHDTRADLLETLAPYFAQGLAANEFCMWITSQSITTLEAEAALRACVPSLDAYLANGQMEIVDFDEWYMADQRFDPDRALQKVAGRLVAALDRGFDGLRISGSTFSLARDNWEAFVRYEAAIDRIVGSKRILAMCTYSLQKWSMSEIFDVIATHDFALAKEDGRWKASKSFSRERIEQGLKESEARLRATIEGVCDGIIATDESGAILSMNPAATRIFGYSLYDLVGQHIGVLSPDQSRFIRLADCAGKLEQGVGVAIHVSEGRRKDGALVPLECTVTESVNQGERLFVIVVRDLTERRQTEARMQKLRADRLDAMGGMAVALSHEIKQPLAAAAAYLGATRRLLRKSLFKPSGVEDAVAKAADQVTRAAQIIVRMRSFVTRGEPDTRPQSILELTREAYELVSGGRLTDIEVKLHIAAGADRVLADKVQIQQVLVNVMRNAIEAMSQSQERMLTVSVSEAEGRMIRTDIADTGPGLSKEIQESLFEPFQTTKATGMGVGLSISRSIIEAHHGRLWAESNRGGGAIFSFTLPSAGEN